MDYAETSMEETEADATSSRVDLRSFERSAKLAELKVAYRSRAKMKDRWPIREAKDVEQWAKRTAALHGFRDAEHVVDIFGLCASCANKQDAEDAQPADAAAGAAR